MLIARRFVVSGRVQGVGFRWFVQEAAAIEALIQGEAEAVLRIDRRIRRGPPAARVEAVETVDEPALDRLSTFEVRD